MKDKSQITDFNKDDVKIDHVETCFNGFFKVNKYHFSHALYQGGYSNTLTREVFERGDAVAVIPYDPVLDKIVFVEQFRIGAYRTDDAPWLLEFIAGMFGEQESPIEVAIREAQEEANLNLDKSFIEPVMKYLSSPGGTSECIHLYVAKVDASNVGGVYGLEHEGEDIKVLSFSLAQAMAYLAEGKISNAATIIGLQWLALNADNLKQRWQTQQ